ncbi:hypothetical protein SAMN06297251_103312 [Fulvimarina manganoxydans]|uniref:Uncharacterized protein n=1 Tax=Fulvimarina manganoxydans TaxID=937218 RepID=A0A1W2A320_9HYPH|nr:hypothetical protein [Fulvimarina manganoxydans]SMC55064.1 hypothetical protein SAMN06297251_103312 [Fulvimarina manganoxydans]
MVTPKCLGTSARELGSRGPHERDAQNRVMDDPAKRSIALLS